MKQLPGLVELTCNVLNVLILTLFAMPPVVLYNFTVAKPADRTLNPHTLAGSSPQATGLLALCRMYVDASNCQDSGYS